jgi:acetoin utilization deacetylase AcuC-like enzyme
MESLKTNGVQNNSYQLFGDEDEEDSSSDYDMLQYRSVTDIDSFAVHRAAEDGDFPRLKENLDRLSGKMERRDTWGLTPLHTSIISCQLECYRALLDWQGTDINSKCQGSPVPHIILTVASLSNNQDFGLQALQLLLDRNFTSLLTESKDDYERTPLRLACELGLEVAFIRLLLTAFEKLSSTSTNNDISAENSDQEDHSKQVLASPDKIKKWNALHAAADLANSVRRAEIMQELLSPKGGFADVVNYFDSCSRTSLHVLVKRTGVFSSEDPCCALLLQAGVNQQFKDVLGREASDYARRGPRRQRRGGTQIFSHEVCSLHFTAPESETLKPYYSKNMVPPENVNRLTVLLHKRFGTLQSRRLLTEMGANHNTNPPKCELVDVLRVHDWGYVKQLKEECEALPEDNHEILGEMDADTTFSAKTYDASLYACGSAVQAIDDILAGKCENAFCAVRPPGHHAGPSGMVPECQSRGFCFLNTVAVAAGYALDRHRDKIKKVAIIDFDVHHGNGTEVCVENLRPNEIEAKFELPLGGKMSFSTPTWKPWLGESDVENVLFCSVHGYGKTGGAFAEATFYPGSGEDKGWKDEKASILDVGQSTGSRYEWRKHWRGVVLPRLLQFKSDLIIISAGFDAHAKDSINSGLCGALEQDYEWLTQALVAVANESCEGRIVSVLEGGYRIQGMCVSAFARSVAEHVRVLTEADPSCLPDPQEIEWELQDCTREIKAAKELEQEMRAARMQLGLRQSSGPGENGGDDEEDEEEEDEENEEGQGIGENAADGDEDENNDNEEFEKEAAIVSDHLATTNNKPTSNNIDVAVGGDRPKRRATKDIDFVKLNEELNREKETKRQKEGPE